ncbi:hypothetical protein QJS10_CPB17g01705 [Acorus calamus]|uniref:Large ribosomal subunit protein bL34c n=1 Tax=Acorus calamus TaxID=4465 RepID=A0AAV9CTU1_ACOCL|nr:hypothetical protein QJS10_CPB17g01705 [Acorus calamus]
MAMAMAALSICPPMASLSLSTGRKSPLLRTTAKPTTTRSALLHSSFISSSSISLSSPSSFADSKTMNEIVQEIVNCIQKGKRQCLSLGINFGFDRVVEKRRRSLQVRAGKAVLAMTKRNRSRKSLARTHGFKRRMRTTSGRAVLKRRRAKGRRILCTKSNPNSGKAS